MTLDIDETGATVKFATFKAARFRVRKKKRGGDAQDAESDSLRARFRRISADLGSQSRQVGVEKDLEADREDGNFASSAGTPEGDSGPRPEMIPAPDSDPLSAQQPSPRAP